MTAVRLEIRVDGTPLGDLQMHQDEGELSIKSINIDGEKLKEITKVYQDGRKICHTLDPKRNYSVFGMDMYKNLLTNTLKKTLDVDDVKVVEREITTSHSNPNLRGILYYMSGFF